MMSAPDLVIRDYNAKSIVVTGETKKHKTFLKEIGGKYNSGLSVGSGWVFPIKEKKRVSELVERINNGEEWNIAYFTTTEKQYYSFLYIPPIGDVELRVYTSLDTLKRENSGFFTPEQLEKLCVPFQIKNKNKSRIFVNTIDINEQ